MGSILLDEDIKRLEDDNYIYDVIVIGGGHAGIKHPLLLRELV